MQKKLIPCVSALLLCWLNLAAQTTAPAAKPAPEQSLSVDYPDMETRAVLRDIADRCELNLIISESLEGKTSIKLRDVTWKQAFKTILTPIGYTYIEDGQIVKVLPLEETLPGATTAYLSRRETPLFEAPWYIAFGAGLIAILIVICHVALFLGVMHDHLPEGTRFAPKFIWALFVLAGGILPLVGYWLIHHSSLAKKEPSITGARNN